MEKRRTPFSNALYDLKPAKARNGSGGCFTPRTILLLTPSQAERREDRKGGPEGRTIKVDVSNIAGAIGKATREFVKSLDRKQRFDMNKGLKVEAVRVPTNKTEPSSIESWLGGLAKRDGPGLLCRVWISALTDRYLKSLTRGCERGTVRGR